MFVVTCFCYILSYLAIGCVEDAVAALAKRGDAASLYTAVRVRVYYH